MKNKLFLILPFVALILFSCSSSVKNKAKNEEAITDSIKKDRVADSSSVVEEAKPKAGKAVFRVKQSA